MEQIRDTTSALNAYRQTMIDVFADRPLVLSTIDGDGQPSARRTRLDPRSFNPKDTTRYEH